MRSKIHTSQLIKCIICQCVLARLTIRDILKEFFSFVSLSLSLSLLTNTVIYQKIKISEALGETQKCTWIKNWHFFPALLQIKTRWQTMRVTINSALTRVSYRCASIAVRCEFSRSKLKNNEHSKTSAVRIC